MDDVLVTSWTKAVVKSAAPAELPMFNATSRAYRAGKLTAWPTKAGKGDDLLGFGIGEAAILVTPVLMALVDGVVKTLLEEASNKMSEMVSDLVGRLRGRFDTESEKVPPRLTEQQLQHLRSVGHDCAEKLALPADQASSLVEHMIAAIAAPPPGAAARRSVD